MYNQIINNISKYAALNKDELLLFKTILKLQTVSKGEYLLQQGKIARHDSYVLNGALKSTYIDNFGKKFILHFAIEDWWITDFESFRNQTPAKLEIEALEDSRLLQINHEALQKLFESSSKFELFYHRMNERYLITLFTRLISLLSKSAEERYLSFIKTYPQFWNRLPQYEIASYLNLSPEHLSRIRYKLSQ